MVSNLSELCRLCAKKESFTKDLLDESNTSILKLIQDFIQINVKENDNLPTKVCLNCEEKMISFQLFILECYKVQDTLQKMILDNITKVAAVKNDVKSKCNVKQEEIEYSISEIKPEVKKELADEHIVDGFQCEDDVIFSDYEQDILLMDDVDDVDDDYDEIDYVAISTLKHMNKRNSSKKEVPTSDDIKKLNEILQRPTFKGRDIVPMNCDACNLKFDIWSNLKSHFSRVHRTKPTVHCLCGFLIRSYSVFYKHVADHKTDVRSSHQETSEGKERLSKINIHDFVKFKCSVCDKKCSSWYTLQSHSQRLHQTSPVVQCKCGVTLKSKSIMYKHIQDHKDPNILKCDQCPKIAKTLQILNKHKLRHIPRAERKFQCSGCDKTFSSKDLLKSHEKSHIPIDQRKIYHCQICNLRFTTRSSVASHKRVVHDKIKSYVCDLCGYACGTKGELVQHRAIHSDDKPFVCRKCSKPFKTYSNLKTHMDTHEDTSYVCYVCDRVLNSRRTLRKHLLVHEDKCRHVCEYCEKAFKRRQTLKVHLNTHTGEKPLSCKWCDERFAYASTLRSHRLRCHPELVAEQTQASQLRKSAGGVQMPHTDKVLDHTEEGYTTFGVQEYLRSDVTAVSASKTEIDAL